MTLLTLLPSTDLLPNPAGTDALARDLGEGYCLANRFTPENSIFFIEVIEAYQD